MPMTRALWSPPEQGRGHVAWRHDDVSAVEGYALGLAQFGPMGTWPACRRRGPGAHVVGECLVDLRLARSAVPIARENQLRVYVRACAAKVTTRFIAMAKSR